MYIHYVYATCHGLHQFCSLLFDSLQFPLVYSPELHFPEFTSVVADMKNSVKVRVVSVVEWICHWLILQSFEGTTLSHRIDLMPRAPVPDCSLVSLSQSSFLLTHVSETSLVLYRKHLRGGGGGGGEGHFT